MNNSELSRLDVSPESMRATMSHFASGLTVVTGMSESGPEGMTVQSFMSLSLDPALVLISVSDSSTTWPRIRVGGRFGVSILARGQQEHALAFATRGGPKFSTVEWEPGPELGVPLLVGAQAGIECEIRDLHDGGDHEIVVGSVRSLTASSDMAQHPLMFFRSAFAHLDARHVDAMHLPGEFENGFV